MKMSSIENKLLNKYDNYLDLKSIELCKNMQKKCSLSETNKMELNFKLNKTSSFKLNENSYSNKLYLTSNNRSSNVSTHLSDLYSKVEIVKPRLMYGELSEKIENKTYKYFNQINHCSLPLTSTEALKYYNIKLTDYEKKEILNYPQVWYIGSDATKVETTVDSNSNFGFDDTGGSYIKVLHDHIAYRYEILEILGKGSFSQVIRAYDHKENKDVALKIIKNKLRFHLQGPSEVQILCHLLKKDREDKFNVIHMYDNFYFRNHLCITFELLSMNIYQLIKKNNYQGLNIHLIKIFSLSILKCLQLLYNENIIHCDLKPENILLKHKGLNSLKVIDFGYSCYNNETIYTYIQSRFYRAPEVILGLQYSMAIDMWSFACILYELYTGIPLFQGENEVEQLFYIMELLDLPPKDLIQESSRKHYFFDIKGNPKFTYNKFYSENKKKIGTRKLTQSINCTDNLFIDFIYKCLTWRQEERMTPNQALQHPWLNSQTNTKANIILTRNNSQEQNIQHFTVKELNTDELLNKTRFRSKHTF